MIKNCCALGQLGKISKIEEKIKLIDKIWIMQKLP